MIKENLIRKVILRMMLVFFVVSLGATGCIFFNASEKMKDNFKTAYWFTGFALAYTSLIAFSCGWNPDKENITDSADKHKIRNPAMSTDFFTAGGYFYEVYISNLIDGDFRAYCFHYDDCFQACGKSEQEAVDNLQERLRNFHRPDKPY